jgi:hypothetical protein
MRGEGIIIPPGYWQQQDIIIAAIIIYSILRASAGLYLAALIVW